MLQKRLSVNSPQKRETIQIVWIRCIAVKYANHGEMNFCLCHSHWIQWLKPCYPRLHMLNLALNISNLKSSGIIHILKWTWEEVLKGLHPLRLMCFGDFFLFVFWRVFLNRVKSVSPVEEYYWCCNTPSGIHWFLYINKATQLQWATWNIMA